MNKILFILGASYIGGLERIAFDLIQGLKSNGFQIKCIINGWNDGTFRKMLEKENIDHTEIKIGSLYIHKPLWTLGTLYHYPVAIYQINRVIRDFQPDIVMHYSYRIFLMIYPVIRRCRNYFHVHERYRGFFYQKLSLPLMLKKVNYFIACSDFIRDNLIKTGIEADKTISIHNGIEFKEAGFIRKPGDELQIGIVGQVIPRKGHHILIKALRTVHFEYSNFRLHIFGKGEDNYINDLKRQIGLLHLEDQVLWHGFEENRDRIYSQLDLVVVPTIDDEPFGLSALEPALYRIPVIVSRVGGLPEIVRDGYNGFYFENKNANDLARQLKKFLNDRKILAEMGNNHYEEAYKKFSMDRMVDEFINLFE